MYTSANEIAALAAQMIEIPSLSGDEQPVLDFVRGVLAGLGWTVERFPAEGRENLFVSFGTPRVVFTTHLDIVPAPDALFKPRLQSGVLHGRGACDAKGIAATMIGAVERLRLRGANNFGLLFVVGEELDGAGARQAAIDLKGRGIEYLINGEPTEGKLMRAHKGVVDTEICCTGRACHSGYPELGEDANLKLVEVIRLLTSQKFGHDEILGDAKINCGFIQAGVAANIISPHAMVKVLVRTVTDSASVIEKIVQTVGDLGTVSVTSVAEPVHLTVVPGFKTDVAAYYTDIPYFLPLGAQALLYGPGSISDAHTDTEKVLVSEIADACDGYERLWHALQS